MSTALPQKGPDAVSQAGSDSHSGNRRPPNVLLCVTGSVAAIKLNQMVHSLQTTIGANVKVVMSKTAEHFVSVKDWPHLGGEYGRQLNEAPLSSSGGNNGTASGGDGNRASTTATSSLLTISSGRPTVATPFKDTDGGKGNTTIATTLSNNNDENRSALSTQLSVASVSSIANSHSNATTVGTSSTTKSDPAALVNDTHVEADHHATTADAADAEPARRDTLTPAEVTARAHLITDDYAYVFNAYPNPDGSHVIVYTDDHEWASWRRLGDAVLHIELRKWADYLVIAPLSANTLAKIVNGQCDTLITCVVRAWDMSGSHEATVGEGSKAHACSVGTAAATAGTAAVPTGLKKGIVVAPAMNTFMWDSSLTGEHFKRLYKLYNTPTRRGGGSGSGNGGTHYAAAPGLLLAPPRSTKLACGDMGKGAIALPAVISELVGKLHACSLLLDGVGEEGGQLANKSEGDEAPSTCPMSGCRARQLWAENDARFASEWPRLFAKPSDFGMCGRGEVADDEGDAAVNEVTAEECRGARLSLRHALSGNLFSITHDDDDDNDEPIMLRETAATRRQPKQVVTIANASPKKNLGRPKKVTVPSADEDDDLSPSEKRRYDSAFLRDGGLTFAERDMRLSVDHPISLALSVHAHPVNARPSSIEKGFVNYTLSATSASSAASATAGGESGTGRKKKQETNDRSAGVKSKGDANTEYAQDCEDDDANLAGSDPTSQDEKRPRKRRLKEYERLVESSCGALEFTAKFIDPANTEMSNEMLLRRYAKLRKGDRVTVTVRDKKTGRDHTGFGCVEWTPLYGGRAMIRYTLLDGRQLKTPQLLPLPPNQFYVVSLTVR